MPAEQAACWMGIDVAKAELVVAVGATGPILTVANDAAGWAPLGQTLATAPPAGIVWEATGVYHRGVTLALAAAGWRPTVLNPAQRHAFRLSEGKQAKTDRLDARVLVRFGQQKQPAPSPVWPDAVRQLKELVACRAEVTKLLTLEKHRQQLATAATVGVHTAIIATLQTQRATIEADIAALLKRDPELGPRAELLQTVPGIGLVGSAVLLAELPELGPLPATPLAALAGVAPHPQESGTQQGRRHLRGGRPAVRRALSLIALTATRGAPVLAAHDPQLCQRRPPKVALIACARRLLGSMTAMLREAIPWSQTHVVQAMHRAAAP